MKKRKILSLFLVGATVATLFAGCGEAEQKTEAVDKSEPTEKVESTASAEVVESSVAEEVVELEEKTIQIWMAGNKQEDTEKVWDAFNEMLQEYVPNTTVEFSIFPQAEYNEKFQQMLASGEGVDVAWAANWVTGNVNTAIADGNYMVLDDLVAEYGQGITETLTKEVEDFHRKADGHLYYLVNWQGLAGNKRGMIVIKDIAEHAGATWIEDTQAAMDAYWNGTGTVADMQKVFDQVALYCEAAKDMGVGTGLDWREFMGWRYNDRLAEISGVTYGVGISKDDNTFTVVDGRETEYYKTFIKNMADFYNKGYIRKDAASVDLATLKYPKDGVVDNNTFIMKFHNILGDTVADEYSLTWGTEAVCIEMEREASLTNGEATINVIPYCADEPERAMMVMNAIYSVPELYQTLIWGIEGEHWTDNGDGTVNYTGGTKSTDTYGYDNWKMGSCINGLTTQTMTPGKYEGLRELESTAYSSPFNNFVFDTTGLEDVIAALKAVYTEYEAQLNPGYHGDDYEKVYEAYMKERKAAGVDKLIEALQKQYDEYIAANNVTSF